MHQLFTIPRNSQRNSNIALLRMCLALYILFFHAIPRYKFYGYDMTGLWDIQVLLIKALQCGDETNPVVIAFLVISGYCIHRNGLRHNHKAVGNFLKRRLLRILPMLTLGTVLGVAVFTCLKHDPRILIITNTQSIELKSVLYKFLGLFAWSPYRFEESVHLGNGPLITCIVEGWLYLFYPVGMWLIIKYGTRVFCGLLLSLLLSGVLFCSIAPTMASWWHNGAVYSFLAYWWLGAFAVNPNTKLYNYKYTNLIGYIGLGLLLHIYPNALCIELRKILLAMLFATFLRWSEDAPELPISPKFLTSSFSIYVLHTPLICLALYWGLDLWLTAGLITLLASITYKYIEQPTLNILNAKPIPNHLANSQNAPVKL